MNMQKLLWSVLTGSVFLLVYLVYMLNSNEVNVEVVENTDLNFVLFPAAIIIAASSFLLRKYLTSKKFLDKIMKSSSDVIDDNFELERERLILKIAEMNFIPLIILLALNEAITNLGFVAALTSNDAGQIIPYAMISTMLNLMIIPNARKIEKTVSQMRSV